MITVGPYLYIVNERLTLQLIQANLPVEAMSDMCFAAVAALSLKKRT